MAAENCVGIAAIEALKLIGNVSCGVELYLEKVRKFWNNKYYYGCIHITYDLNCF